MNPLVLIPGLGNTSALFDGLIDALHPHDYRHVNLIAPSVQNFDQMLDHVRGQLPKEPFDLLGFSMGGYVSLALAIQGQTPIRRLILANSRAVDDDPEEVGERSRTLRLLTNPKTRFEGMTPVLFQRLVGKTYQHDMQMFEGVRLMALEVGREGLAAQIRSNQTRPNMLDDLPGLNLPTLIIGGSEDKLTPPRHAENLHVGIAGSKLAILDGCGHLGPLERPYDMAALIQDFLD